MLDLKNLIVLFADTLQVYVCVWLCVCVCVCVCVWLCESDALFWLHCKRKEGAALLAALVNITYEMIHLSFIRFYI